MRFGTTFPKRLASAVCSATAPFKGPYAFGHEFVAEVLEVGDQVTQVRPGMRVAVSFQICCGSCEFCGKGLTANCRSVPPRSMYGFGDLGGHEWGGALSDIVRVPFADFMMVPLPHSVDPASVASLPDNIVDAWRTVGPGLREVPGGSVLIVAGAAHSIGLYTVAIAKQLGASAVVYVDKDATRRELAATLGATEARAAHERVRPEFDITVEASASEPGLSAAIRSTRPGGVCTSVGIYYSPAVAMPLIAMYGIGVRFLHGRVHSRMAMPEVLPLITSGQLQPERVTSRLARWDDAIEALLESGPKVVVERA